MQKIIKYTKEQLEQAKPTLTEDEKAFLADRENSQARKKYSIVEFVQLLDDGRWTGGYVTGMGNVPADMFTKIESDDSNIDIFVPTSPSDDWPNWPPHEPDSSDSGIPPLPEITEIQSQRTQVDFDGRWSRFSLSGTLINISEYYNVSYKRVKGKSYYAYNDVFIFLTLISRYSDRPQHKLAGMIPNGFNFENNIATIGTSIPLNKNENDSFSLYLDICEGGTSEYDETLLAQRFLLIRK